MSRPDPIQYAERLYTAIRAANFSPISFLAFGNAVKDGVDFRRMPLIAAEPFMRVVGEMLDLEEHTAEAGDIVDAEVAPRVPARKQTDPAQPTSSEPVVTSAVESAPLVTIASPQDVALPPSPARRSRDRR
jgi:hypothetical protein